MAYRYLLRYIMDDIKISEHQIDQNYGLIIKKNNFGEHYIVITKEYLEERKEVFKIRGYHVEMMLKYKEYLDKAMEQLTANSNFSLKLNLAGDVGIKFEACLELYIILTFKGSYIQRETFAFKHPGFEKFLNIIEANKALFYNKMNHVPVDDVIELLDINV